LDEEDLIAQDEALMRYQVNVQLLEELFDGKSIEDLASDEVCPTPFPFPLLI
jgi:hypothetical protein